MIPYIFPKHESLERERVKKFPEEICRLDRGGGREKNFWFFSILMFAQTTNMWRRTTTTTRTTTMTRTTTTTRTTTRTTTTITTTMTWNDKDNDDNDDDDENDDNDENDDDDPITSIFWSSFFLRFNQWGCDMTCCCSCMIRYYSVWPDLAKFRHFGTLLKIFGHFEGVH